MKKHLFLLSSVFALLSLQAQEATMMVAADTNVKVKTGTTLYVGGEMKVANYTENSKKISNEGNIKITQKLTNENNTDGSNFVNEFVGVGKYGQLIINSGSSINEGKIASEISFNGSANFLDIAIPYKDKTGNSYTVQDFVKQAFDVKEDISNRFIGYLPGRNNGHPEYGPKYDIERYKNPLFYWDNTAFLSRHLTPSEQLNNPERAYALSSFSPLKGFYKVTSGRDVRPLSGVPSKDEIEVEVSTYKISYNSNTNEFGEAYGSYITDFTKTPPQNWASYGELNGGVANPTGYGENIFYFGNPYTSNIDLSKGVGFTNAEAIYQSTSYNYNEDWTALSSTYSQSSIATKDRTGDYNVEYVRPFQTFAVKLDGQESTHKFIFRDEMKVFSIPEGTNAINNLFLKNRGNSSPVSQVGIDLYDTNGFTGIKTYVVASEIYEASQKGRGVEVYDIIIEDKHTGIYTLQEKEDGAIDETFIENKTYINGVNESKYIAKPIHLVFQNGKGQYTFKARLNQDLKNNKNSFYFEDKKDGKIIKIDENFSYTFNVDGTDKDRFVLYWAALPTEEITKEIVEESVDTTVIFKDQDSYKIRFDKEMGTADVFVYSISGQLINVDKKVNTSNDYIVPVVGNASVYIVKVIGNNGKIVTKKIIK